MRLLILLLITLFCFLSLDLNIAEAARKKPAAVVVPKPIYEAPMRVVIVRNSDPKCEPNCPQWISAEGEITNATPQAFRRAFKQMGKAKLPIVIRSPGGSIEAALSIGRMIRERGLTIAVAYTRYKGCTPDNAKCKLPKEAKGIYNGEIDDFQAFCNSACPILLAGGSTRLISYEAFAGVHQPKTTWSRTYVRFREYYRIVNGKKKVISRKIISRENRPEEVTFGFDKRLLKTLTAYFTTMGIDLAILDESNKADFKSVNFLNATLIKDLKLRNSPLAATLLSEPRKCGAVTISAVCVLDKARQEALSLNAASELSLVDSLTANVKLARRGGPACIEICPIWIAIEGTINSATVLKLKQLLDLTESLQTPIILNAVGEDMQSALRMGGLIYSARREVIVARTKELNCSQSPVSCKGFAKRVAVAAEVEPGGRCDGLCALVLAAGRERILSNGATVTLIDPGTLPRFKRDAYKASVLEYLQVVRDNPKLRRRLLGNDRGEMYALNALQLWPISLVNNDWNGVEFGESKRCSTSPIAGYCMSMK